MSEEYPGHTRIEDALAIKVRDALRGQTPEGMLAMSVGVDRDRRCLLIRAHFDRPISGEDEELIPAIGTEIISQWVVPDWDIEEDWEVLSPGQEPNALPGGIAFRRRDPEPPMAGS